MGKFTCDHGNWPSLVLDQYGQMGVLGGETGMVFNVKTTTTTTTTTLCGSVTCTMSESLGWTSRVCHNVRCDCKAHVAFVVSASPGSFRPQEPPQQSSNHTSGRGFSIFDGPVNSVSGSRLDRTCSLDGQKDVYVFKHVVDSC